MTLDYREDFPITLRTRLAMCVAKLESRADSATSLPNQGSKNQFAITD